MNNYNKQINRSCQYGFSNICAYPEFFNYCLRYNLSAIEITILNYILSNSKEWEISPTTIGNVYNIPRETASRALTKLQSKLNGDLIISSRSKGGNGTLVNATKVYEEIYNEISGKKQLENPPESESESESEEIVEENTEETPCEKKITPKNIPDKLLAKYNFCVSKYPIKEIELWCRQNNIQYEIA